MYGWQCCLYHDNANGINGFTDDYLLLVRTVLQKQTAHGLRRQLIWLVVVTRGAVGLRTWNATANATM